MIELFSNTKLNLNFKTSLLDFAIPVIGDTVGQFHQSLPNYNPTPLLSLNHLAQQLGVKSIRVKDESKRFALNAFKGLGASYAMANYLAELTGLSDQPLNFDTIRAHLRKYSNTVFVTATDGNHGRAVAWSAQLFGCQSVIYMPKGSSSERLEAIRSYGAQASITEFNYDDTVLHASKMAEKNDWILIQDTAWEGYEKIPLEIMQGYFTLVSECLRQAKGFWPTHVFLQAGVGSFAAAILGCMYQLNQLEIPKFIIVEPNEAPCLFESMNQNNGEAYKVEGSMPTIMAGLACGEPSSTALQILRSYAHGFIKCDDDVTKAGMRLAASPKVNDQAFVSGESGAVTLGLLNELLTNSLYKSIKDDLNLNGESRVLLFSTEGNTDPYIYEQIVHLN